jgi:hypothetical protein
LISGNLPNNAIYEIEVGVGVIVAAGSQGVQFGMQCSGTPLAINMQWFGGQTAVLAKTICQTAVGITGGQFALVTTEVGVSGRGIIQIPAAGNQAVSVLVCGKQASTNTVYRGAYLKLTKTS